MGHAVYVWGKGGGASNPLKTEWQISGGPLFPPAETAPVDLPP